MTVISGLGAAQAPLYLSVWTDKLQYNVGEAITIYYYTNNNCMAKLVVYKPDGSAVTVINNWISAGLNTLTGQVGYPLGQRTVVFECQAAGAYAQAQAYFSVVSGPGGGVTGQICITFPFGVICIGGPGPGPGPSPGPGGSLPSLPPFPGIGYDDFGQGQGSGPLTLAIMPTISPNGFRTVWLGTSFPITISGIDAANFTAVFIAEWQPSGMWSLYNFSGWHPSGQVTANWVGNLRGTYYIIAWVDNNHNWSVDFGELTIPWLTVQVW
ncbi:TPA: hypothetical protein EYP12_00690 [Candidatus Bipolaricaulota bacterium]|nr:hypothetical protein [Candidatus Bipolaricaulota bacterium]